MNKMLETSFRFKQFKLLIALGCTVFILLFNRGVAMAQTSPQTFNSSTTWTCPAGVTSVDVEMWGGGGGGGGDGTSNTAGGGGGGSGAYRKVVNVAVTPGNSYTITVGNGGSGGSSFSGDGGKGGQSIFVGDNETVKAGGGCGGRGNDDGSSSDGAGGCTNTSSGALGCFPFGSDCSPQFAFFPNVATNGTGGETGNNRGGAGGTNAAAGSGNGGASRTTDGVGNPGTQPGGGGGGAYRTGSFSRAGASGGAGRIILSWTPLIPPPPVILTYPASACAGEFIKITGISIKPTPGPITITVGGVTVTPLYFYFTSFPPPYEEISFQIPLGAVTGPITFTNPGGTGTSAGNIIINPSPNVSIIPSLPSICNGASVILTASGATTYSWSPPTDLSATSGASVTASPAATTTYTVTGTTDGCSAVQNVTVTVNTALPPPSIEHK
jgi:hypothetical protein